MHFVKFSNSNKFGEKKKKSLYKCFFVSVTLRKFFFQRGNKINSVLFTLAILIKWASTSALVFRVWQFKISFWTQKFTWQINKMKEEIKELVSTHTSLVLFCSHIINCVIFFKSNFRKSNRPLYNPPMPPLPFHIHHL